MKNGMKKIRLIDITEIRNIEKPILIGHSMGGGLALAIASDYPELIKKIIAVVLWHHF